MILKSITARHFMRYPEITLESFPEKGLIGIFGPNEAGKSTIGHVISYALFGVTCKATKAERDQIIQWGAKSCSVELVFGWEGTDYRISRRARLKGSPEARLENLSSNTPIATGVREVNSQMNELLGFDFRSFRYSTYVAQKELRLILDSSQDRRAVINNLLGIDAIECARKLIPAKIKDLEKGVANLQQQHEKVDQQLTDLQDKQRRMKEAEKQHAKATQDLDKRQQERKVLQENLAFFDRYRETYANIDAGRKLLQEKTSQLKSARKQLEEIEQAKTDRTRLSEQLKDFEDVDSSLTEQRSLRTMLFDFTAKLVNVEKQVTALKSETAAKEGRLSQNQQDQNTRKKEAQTQVGELEGIWIDKSAITSLDSAIRKKSLFRFISAIGGVALLLVFTLIAAKGLSLWFLPLLGAVAAGIAWYLLGRAVSALQDQGKQHEKDKLRLEQRDTDLARQREARDQAEETLERINVELQSCTALAKILGDLDFGRFAGVGKSLRFLKSCQDDKVQPIIEALMAIQSSQYPFIDDNTPIGKYREQLEDRIEVFNERLTEKRQLETQRTDLGKAIAKEEEASDLMARLEKDIEGLAKELADLADSLPAIKYSEAEHGRLKECDTQLQKTIQALEKEAGGKEGVSGTLQKDVEQIPAREKERDRLEHDIAEHERALEVQKILNDAYTRTQERIRHSLTPNIEQYFSWILPRITNDRYKKVSLSDNFGISAFSTEKDDFVDLGVLSGGTEDQLLLSLRLAFARSLIPGDAQLFLFLDEPISAFDESRRSSFLEFLRLLETTFRQIFLITHLTGLENYVDRFIRISETDDGNPVVECSWV